MPKKGKASLEDRLHRIQGQIRGIEGMLKGPGSTESILIQIQAVISGLESVKLELVKKGIKDSLEKQVMGAIDLLK